MKLILIKSNKDKYKVAQRVFSFQKKTRLTVMNMHSKLLNNDSLHPPLSAGVGWGLRLNLQPNFTKKGGLDRTTTCIGGLLGKRGLTLFRGGVTIFT